MFSPVVRARLDGSSRARHFVALQAWKAATGVNPHHKEHAERKSILLMYYLCYTRFPLTLAVTLPSARPQLPLRELMRPMSKLITAKAAASFGGADEVMLV
jgi:hypothetical protein